MYTSSTAYKMFWLSISFELMSQTSSWLNSEKCDWQNACLSLLSARNADKNQKQHRNEMWSEEEKSRVWKKDECERKCCFYTLKT